MRGFFIALSSFAFALVATVAQADLPSCKNSKDGKEVFREIAFYSDKGVVFHYFETELVDEFTVEYLNCDTGYNLSIPVNQRWKARDARTVLKRAITSNAQYTTGEVSDALRSEGLRAKAGDLNSEICVCWDKVKTASQRALR